MTLRLFVSFALLASFFLPLFEWNSFEMSGLNYILSTHTPRYKYFLLLIPFSASLIFLEAWYEDDVLFRKKIISWAPFFSLLLVFFLRFVKPDYVNTYLEYTNAFSTTYLGFWLTLFFSALLPLLKNRKELNQGHKLPSIVS